MISSPSVSAQPRRQRRKEARPAELAAAAYALFVEKGFAATRLDDVAQHAGVAKGTLYLYFDSKEALFRAVIEDSILPLIGEVESLVTGWENDPARLLEALLRYWWERALATPLGGICKLMVSEAGNFPEVAAYFNERVIGPWVRLLNEVIEKGMQRGVFRYGDVETVRQTLFYPLLMRVVWRYSLVNCPGQPAPADEHLDTYFDVIFNGLLAAPVQKDQ